MESILNAIVAMGIKEGPLLFQITAQVIGRALRKGKTCEVDACKGKACNSNACKGKARREIHVRVMHVMV
jgi:hypothetical protein